MHVGKPHVAVEEAVAQNAGKEHHLQQLVAVLDGSYYQLFLPDLMCDTTLGSAFAVSMLTG